MPDLQMPECIVVAVDHVAGALEPAGTVANYAEWVATDLAMNVPSRSLARHSPVFGIVKSVFRLAARRTICPRGLPAGIRAGE